MNAAKLKPIQFRQDLADDLDSELQRIGAYDKGGGGYIAINYHGYLGVADTSNWYVSEGVIDRLKTLADNYICQGEYSERAWEVVGEALREPDFSDVDSLVDEVFESIGESGYWTQKSPQALVYYKEENSDARVLSGVPGDYARYYLETNYV